MGWPQKTKKKTEDLSCWHSVKKDEKSSDDPQTSRDFDPITSKSFQPGTSETKESRPGDIFRNLAKD